MEVPRARVGLDDAVTSYLFNSQLLRLPGASTLTLIAPSEVRENNRTASYVAEMISQPNAAIGNVEYVEVRESMRNGGGPACLRLRIVMTPNERARRSARLLPNRRPGRQPRSLGPQTLPRRPRPRRSRRSGARHRNSSRPRRTDAHPAARRGFLSVSAGMSCVRPFLLFLFAAAFVLTACEENRSALSTDLMRVRISAAPPGEEEKHRQDVPFAAELCFPRAYSAGNFRESSGYYGAAVVEFSHPSLEPSHEWRTKVRLTIWPSTGNDMDYSDFPMSRTGVEAPHPSMTPASIAVELAPTATHPVGTSQFPTFDSDTYAIVSIDDEWRRRVFIRCHVSADRQIDSCGAHFQSSHGFLVDLGARADTIRDLSAVMQSADTLITRFLSACAR